MNGRKTGRLILWVLVIAGSMWSCRSSKDSRATVKNVPVESVGTFTSRARFILSDGEKAQSINGSIRMVQGEFIQISLLAPVLRTEAVRIDLTPERMLLIDRTNKQYALAPPSDLQKLMGNGLEYSNLEDILMEALFFESPDGWMMRQGDTEITIPYRNQGYQAGQLLIELSRIALPGQKPTPSNPPSRYDKKELTEVIEDIEKL